MKTAETIFIGIVLPLGGTACFIGWLYWLANRAIDRTERHSDYDGD